MDAWRAKRILSGFNGKEAICSIFAKWNGLPRQDADAIWEGYLEFMVIKVWFGCQMLLKIFELYELHR